MNFRQVEQRDDLLQVEFFPVILGRPPEQTEIIAHRLGQIAVLYISIEARALVALAHLRAVLVQDERDVREARRHGAKRAVELDMLRRIRKMIFAADHVGNFHLDVVDHIHEMKNPRAIRPADGHVGIAFPRRSCRTRCGRR